jgi:hypothetical protein
MNEPPIARPARDIGVVSHAAARLASAIVVATASPTDPRTLTRWGQAVGVSRGALRVWCKAAGVQARQCLDFLRVLRAIVQSTDRDWDPFNLLDVVDQRSLVRLLNRGGVEQLWRSERLPTIDEFLQRQRFLENADIVEAVSRRLAVGR